MIREGRGGLPVDILDATLIGFGCGFLLRTVLQRCLFAARREIRDRLRGDSTQAAHGECARAGEVGLNAGRACTEALLECAWRRRK